MVARPLLALVVAGTILAGCGVDGTIGVQRQSAIRACESANTFARRWEVVADGVKFQKPLEHQLARTIETASQASQDAELQSATEELLRTAGPVLTDGAVHATFDVYGACHKYGLHLRWNQII